MYVSDELVCEVGMDDAVCVSITGGHEHNFL